MKVHSFVSLPRWHWPGCLLALCCLSCSSSKSEFNPVQGKVLYKDQPLAGATVTFHPKGKTDLQTIRPVGLTKEDGSFALNTGPDAGAPAGQYIVTFICSEVVGQQGDKKVISSRPPETRDRLQGAYADAQTSTFQVEIKIGPNQLAPFQLK
jgi:hypothetical protein